ncbi:MAG: Uma2 family endonuclease, partial [Terriglobales bacterium]
VFEILSPEDQVRRMLAKLGDYEAMGIRQIWVVDPDGPRFYRYQAGALQPSAEFGTSGEPVHFALAEVARLLD